MMSTQLYLIRHGQSEGNLADAFLGHTDLDLTPLGHLQAEATANYLADIHADKIYASDLLRAYHTGVHTAEKKGMAIEKCEGLREIYAGLWENRRFADLAVEFAEDYGIWCTDIGNARCTQGESARELQTRVCRQLLDIARANEGGTVFIFSHATPIRAASNYFMGRSLDEMKDLPWPGNASVTHMEYHDNQMRVIDYSRDDFLGSLSTKLPQNV